MSITKLRSLDGQPIGLDFLSIAMGAYPGIIGVNKFGTNETVGTSFEDVWEAGGAHVEIPTATTLEVASTDANDTAAGTGARTVTISGLDADYAMVDETVTLNGQTPVVTVGLFLHVNRVLVVSAGSSQSNEGAITVADDSTSWSGGAADTASAVEVTMPAGHGQTQAARYTVPADYTAFVTNGYCTAAAGKTVTFRFNMLTHGTESVKRVIFEGTLLNTEFVKAFAPYSPMPEKATMWVTGKVDSQTAEVSAGFDLILVPNKYLQ